MQVMRHVSIPCTSSMKNNLIYKFTLTVLLLITAAVSVEAKAVVGDIILQGTVLRSGQQLPNDTSVFEGDSIRTERASGGVLRVAHGRVEIAESSEVEVVRQNPLKIVVKSGTIAFNFPAETAVEIVTPQLDVHPNLSNGMLSGIVTATPQTEDRVQSRTGNFTVVERQRNGAANHIVTGEVVVAALLPAVHFSTDVADPISPAPQGPIGGAQIATLARTAGDVRVARVATPNNYARVAEGTPNTPLATGDFVRTLNGRATVSFTPPDTSQLTLLEGTTIQIQQQKLANTTTRRVTQAIGNLWFSIQRVTGTQTTLETPTAVAAIRGTEGTQDVPNNTQSTHALNEGIEQITEVVTSTSVTIRTGQRVTAIRGVGFTPIAALLAAITQPVVGTGGGGGGGAGGGGAAGGGVGGAAGAATGATVASTVSTVTSTVFATAATGISLATAAIVPVVTSNTTTASATTPLNPPGGQ